MISSNRWWARAGAALTAVVMSMLVPAVAWAESTGAGELLRKRPKGGFGFFGFFGVICCLVVVVAVVVLVVMLARRKSGGNKGPF